MKDKFIKFLIGVPIVSLGLFIISLPYMLWGEVGILMESIVWLIGVVLFLTYVIGEEILEKIKKKRGR